jgi:hypothetical protein
MKKTEKKDCKLSSRQEIVTTVEFLRIRLSDKVKRLDNSFIVIELQKFNKLLVFTREGRK